mgnify:CR=1 FL=1
MGTKINPWVFNTLIKYLKIKGVDKKRKNILV